ncbi:MAG: GNAT family protein [Bacteroidota bacterium]
METYPSLSTERLVLNQPQVKDIPSIVQHVGNPNVSFNLLNVPHPYHELDAVFWINQANQSFKDGSKYVFAIRLKKNLELIGGMGLHVNKKHKRAELGYWLQEESWGQGLTTEAATAVIAFGFETLQLHKVMAIHVTSNPASGRVMQKIGMRKEGELKGHIQKNGVYQDIVQYGVIRPSSSSI